MTKVIGVRFRTAGKIYYFSPGKFEIKQYCLLSQAGPSLMACEKQIPLGALLVFL